MGKNTQLSAGKFRGINDAGMDQLIDYDYVFLGDQRTNRSQCRGVAGCEGERGFGCLEFGERFFQLMVRRKRTAN